MEQLEHKLAKRAFKVTGPLDQSDLAEYDRAKRYFMVNDTWKTCKCPFLRESLMVDYALYCVSLKDKYQRNGRRY